ncbi:MAG TPA: kelch repeat-containing protein [Planctomycetota bacterium]|nr:kelch repeat-containing protein [Planctomycetota bacterium]
MRVALALSCLLLPGLAPAAGATNEWVKVSENAVGPGFSPGLVWSPEIKRFVLFCGAVSHHFKGERPYDVMSFDPVGRTWRNELPKGAEARGGETGNVKDVEFKTPYFAMADAEGLVRPNRRHLCMWHHYALAPWDGKVYALICGRVLCYDPRERAWKDMQAAAGPMPVTKHHRESLSWSALCADPVNREIVLFGGCGVLTENGSPGTWVYSPEENRWRKLEERTEPPPRALSPMAFDPTTKKIVLFGGDRLDQLYADTWVYDCATRTWEERKPALSPSPRFGHALLRLPKSGRIVLLGGKTYTSSTSYCATLYKPLPFEIWSYDVAANEWELIRRFEKDGPADYQHRGGADSAAVAAASDEDLVLWVGAGTEKGSAHSTWLCQLDASTTDAEGTAKYGVKPGTLEFRTGSFDPEWYTKDVPPPDLATTEAVLKGLRPNTWTPLKCPKWLENRQGGGWSTVTLDTDRGQILHMGGGHSSYFGNDVAHYDIATGRWTIACRPQFALEYNYDLSGPGLWAFNGAPWGNHNYQAYDYDATIKRLVYIKGHMTLFYDPATRTWPFAEKFDDLPFRPSKYINILCATPQGVVCWTQTKPRQSVTGLWRLAAGKSWEELKTSGDALPMTVCDGSTLSYDSKRNRLLMTTTPEKDGEAAGQVWSCDLATGEAKKLDPAGREAVVAKRFAREAVYLPKSDLVMIGYLSERDGGLVVPFYDCAGNRWLAARMAGAEFINGGKAGSSVDLGLAYDSKRDVVWATLCSLRREGALQVVRVDAATLGAAPLK